VFKATFCAAIVILLPYSLVYPRMLMSENLYWPLFLLGLLVLFAS
jgi:hypothetical protein